MLPKGQHSWNISVTKEARVDPKGSSGIVDGMPFSRNLFLTIFFFFLNKKTYFKMMFQALLLVTNQAKPFKGLFTAVHPFV